MKYEELSDSVIERRGWNEGLWQRIQHNTICSKLKPFVENKEGKVIDVGGNSGYQTVWHLQYSDCITYEPVPGLADILEKNLSRTQFNHSYEVRRKAVGNTEGEIEFFVDSNRLSMTSQIPLVENYSVSKLPMTTLDSDVGEERIKFIKIDVEGFELDCLNGATNIIEKQKPIFMIEIYQPWCEKTGIYSELYFSFFFDRGYQCFFFDSQRKELVEVNSIEEGVNSVKNFHHLHDGDFLFMRQ